MGEIEGIDEKEIEFYLPMNKQTYFQRFQRISQGKWTFNFCAAILGEAWFAYQLLFGELIAIILFNIVAEIVITIQIRCFYTDSYQMLQAMTKCSLSVIGLKMILFGLIGDRLLWRSVKLRAKRDHKSGKNRFNIFKEISSRIEASEKRGLARGVTVIVSAGIILALYYGLVPEVINIILY